MVLTTTLYNVFSYHAVFLYNRFPFLLIISPGYILGADIQTFVAILTVFSPLASRLSPFDSIFLMLTLYVRFAYLRLYALLNANLNVNICEMES